MSNAISRRSALQAGAGGFLAGTLGAGLSPRAARGQAVDPPQPPQYPPMEVFASGLDIPEGPVLGADGSLLVSEIAARALTLIRPDGTKRRVVDLPGEPAGSAMGPDGLLYTTLLGRSDTVPAMNGKPGKRTAFAGKIVRVNLQTRQVEDVVAACDGRPLRSPDDLIFDGKGGFYFTDVGLYSLPFTSLDQTGVYYFDGVSARRVVGPTFPTNGIGLSPAGDRLYWTEYVTGRLYAREIAAPGVLSDPKRRNGDCIYIHPTPVCYFDSLRVDAEGCVSVAVHDGTATGKSGIMSFKADGAPIEFVPFPDTNTTNIVFSWTGPKVAYVTLSMSGRVMKLPWPRAGLKPLYPLPTIG